VTRERGREAAAWAVAVAIAYARIGAELSERPVSEWIAPAWPAGEYMHGLYREHPAGTFWPTALLARAGYPAQQAAYAVNVLFQAATLLLAQRLAASVSPDSRALLWALQLLPVAFTYRARANQEQAVLAFLLLALVGVEESRRSPRWTWATVIGLLGVGLVKGVFVAPAILACAAWAWLRRSEGGSARAWTGLGIATVAMAATALAYESVYSAVTGASFLDDYLHRQVASGVRGPADSVASTAADLWWYGVRLLWFAFPWSVVALLMVPKAVRQRSTRAALAAALVLAYLVPMAFMERRAERYVFPAYFVLGAAGALAARSRWQPLAKLGGLLERPYVPQALFVLLLLVHLAGGVLGLPRIKLG
jgi:hypothetical protein